MEKVKRNGSPRNGSSPRLRK